MEKPVKGDGHLEEGEHAVCGQGRDQGMGDGAACKEAELGRNEKERQRDRSIFAADGPGRAEQQLCGGVSADFGLGSGYGELGDAGMRRDRQGRKRAHRPGHAGLQGRRAEDPAGYHAGVPELEGERKELRHTAAPAARHGREELYAVEIAQAVCELPVAFGPGGLVAI